MICTISVLISMCSSPTGGSMSPPTILWLWHSFGVSYKRPSNSDIICVCWPILSPHLRSGWGIVMSISVLCANTSAELMCALRKAGGGSRNLFSLPVSSPKQKQQRALCQIKKTHKLLMEYGYQSILKIRFKWKLSIFVSPVSCVYQISLWDMNSCVFTSFSGSLFLYTLSAAELRLEVDVRLEQKNKWKEGTLWFTLRVWFLLCRWCLLSMGDMWTNVK